ncbi:thioredoxin family protein [Paenibacillus sp. N3/727]|nr:thioredoxin family protein [Paenibacillus sp. N3/727]UNK20714.1 thioredoxin family protein [Paenibacillus sp. N3/727]
MESVQAQEKKPLLSDKVFLGLDGCFSCFALNHHGY